MKHILLATAAVALVAGAASAQEEQQFTTSTRMGEGVVVRVELFVESPDTSSPILTEMINKELGKSTRIDIVNNPVDVARVWAPIKIQLPPNNKGKMKVAWQFAFPRGSEQDFNVSCDVGKPADCARDIRTRVERIIREDTKE